MSNRGIKKCFFVKKKKKRKKKIHFMHTCIDCHINLFLEASHISIDDPSLIYIYIRLIYIYT